MSTLFRKCGLLAVAVLLPLFLSGCPKYALTVQVTGQGSVAVDPAGGPYKKNTTVTLTPAPAAGWHFDRWEGDLSGTANPAPLVMDAAKTVTAVFTADPFALTVLVTGQGAVTADPAGGSYTAGTTVTLTPVPAAGWQFDHWEGALAGSANPASLVMDAAKTVTAVFVADQYALTVLVTGQGTVTADPAGGSYTAGTTVTLTPVPAAGWHFDHWEGALTGSASPGTVVMDAPKTVTAVFAETLCALNVTVTGGGTVALNPPGGVYAPGTQVTLTATPDTGWHFDQWQGDLSGGATWIQVTMDAAKSVTAVFEREEYTLTVLPTGGGSVTLDPPGGTYPYETVVTLTPVPDAGNRFEIWGGELSGTAEPITLTVTANHYVNAFFMPETYTLFAPNSFCAVGSTLYFLATGPYSGRELWRTDGTYEGTRLVKDLYPGPDSANINFLTSLNGALYFFAGNGSEYGLWTSDGTEEGTVWVTGLGGSQPALPPLRIGGALYFSAVSLNNGELWATDGIAQGTRLVKAWGPDTGYPASNPGQLADVGGVLYFNNRTQVEPQQMTL